jgi:hypothetical protein
MQPSTTNVNQERIPFQLNAFLIGQNHHESRSVKQFHKYRHKAIETGFTIDHDSDDDEHFILSGRSCLLCP